mmetsp:Transcript_50327/g.81597  ORF Transcript_50327/g.81597 Transcript_50327/m.81597 type:complete len:93 (-) Transcript_50327:196-474(-)
METFAASGLSVARQRQVSSCSTGYEADDLASKKGQLQPRGVDCSYTAWSSDAGQISSARLAEELSAPTPSEKDAASSLPGQKMEDALPVLIT